MTFEAVQLRDDSYGVDAEGIVRVRDSCDTLIMYDSAVAEMDKLCNEMLAIGTHYLQVCA